MYVYILSMYVYMHAVCVYMHAVCVCVFMYVCVFQCSSIKDIKTCTVMKALQLIVCIADSTSLIFLINDKVYNNCLSNSLIQNMIHSEVAVHLSCL